jgi:amidase
MVHEIPWRQEQEQAVKTAPEKLAFGIFRHDGLVTPFPPVSRAMEEVAQALQDAGNQVSHEPIKLAAEE